MENKDNFSMALAKIQSEAGLMSYTTTACNVCNALKILGKNEIKLNNQIAQIQQKIDELDKKVPQDHSAEIKMLNDNMVYIKNYIGKIIDYMKQFNIDIEAKFDDMRRNTVTKEPEVPQETLNERLTELFESGFIGTPNQIAEETGISINSIYIMLRKYIKDGKVKKVGGNYQKEIHE